jgi:hypothetical protein
MSQVIFPRLEFYSFPLCLASRHQLSNIYKTRTAWVLADIIQRNAFNSDRGFYVPLSPTIYLVRKLPDLSKLVAQYPESERSLPFPATYFTNGLVVPENYDCPSFDPEGAAAPKSRATNIGFLIITHEFDCKTTEQFESILSWTRGQNGDLSKSVLSRWDSELLTFKEYRGYSVVFAGRRSLHFHFMFSTEHLEHAPFDATGVQRQTNAAQQSALMHNAHSIYWDNALEALHRVLTPACPSDPKLRSLTQWRRCPWGIRILEKDAPFLGLSKGTRVPQIVIRERIRARAPKGSKEFAVPPSFSLSDPLPATRPKKTANIVAAITNGEAMLAMLQQICAAEWGSEYPKPVSIKVQDGEWLFNFQNHEQDRHPSTIVLGEYRKLKFGGEHSFQSDYFLPDQMTAQELGDHVNARCGGIKETAIDAPSVDQQHTMETPAKSTGVVQGYADAWMNSFSRDIEISQSRDKHIETYRTRLIRTLGQVRAFENPYVIKAVEGLGKTSAHFSPIALEAFDGAVDSYRRGDPTQRFSGFAFRSHDQARQKAEECRAAGHHAVVVASFWHHYEKVCEENRQEPLPAHSFADASSHGVLAEIKRKQPEIYTLLEERRKSLWKSGSFDSGTTILFLTHALAQTWHYSRTTRNWYHPDFDPSDSTQDLRDQFVLDHVVFDELETDEFLHILSEPTYAIVQRKQREHQNWRNLPRLLRFNIFASLQLGHELPASTTFEAFDELMRLDLSKLDAVEMNYEAIPFGNDNTSSGIYRRRDGKKYYIAARQWPFVSTTKWAFLTTENLMTDIVFQVYEKQYGKNNPLVRLDLDHLPGLYPIQVPIYIDKRSVADRHQPKVSQLAREIVDADANAVVISNGVVGVERVLTFQKSKGMNDLNDKNIYVILTPLAPEQIRPVERHWPMVEYYRYYFFVL